MPAPRWWAWRLPERQTDKDTKADSYFCFDWNMVGFHLMMRYELGEGLRAENNDRVIFTSDRICGLKAWGGMGDSSVMKTEQTELVALIADTHPALSECRDDR